MMVAVVPTVPATRPVKALASSRPMVGPNGNGLDTDPITDSAWATLVSWASTKATNTHPHCALARVDHRSSTPENCLTIRMTPTRAPTPMASELHDTRRI